MKAGYYDEKLAGSRLKRCYDLAPPRVQQYLDAEISHVNTRLKPSDIVLELGCGYGRAAFRFAEVVRRVVGIDTAGGSVALARELAAIESRCEFKKMDALDLQFQSGRFDAVICIQNGICAFGADQDILVREALRVCRPGGLVIFSTYSDSFWDYRLEWFRAQSEAGLLGEIDYSLSVDGSICCIDGFKSGRLTPQQFVSLFTRIGYECSISEVDGSSVFCEVVKHG